MLIGRLTLEHVLNLFLEVFGRLDADPFEEVLVERR